jgi:hypothetical protein
MKVDHDTRPLASDRKMKSSERKFLGVTLLGKAKREAPVRTEPHPTQASDPH